MRRQRSYEVASASKRGAEHFAQSLTSRRNGFPQRISPSSNHNQYLFREFGRFHHSKIRQVKSAILLCGWPTKRRFYPRLSSDQERKSPTAGSCVQGFPRGDHLLTGVTQHWRGGRTVQWSARPCTGWASISFLASRIFSESMPSLWSLWANSSGFHCSVRVQTCGSRKRRRVGINVGHASTNKRGAAAPSSTEEVREGGRRPCPPATSRRSCRRCSPAPVQAAAAWSRANREQ